MVGFLFGVAKKSRMKEGRADWKRNEMKMKRRLVSIFYLLM
jgi:hypothetical protein